MVQGRERNITVCFPRVNRCREGGGGGGELRMDEPRGHDATV